MRMKDSEWVKYAPSAGTGRREVRVNHVSPTCSGSSKSLRIIRDVSGRLSAKCFRCGAWGVHSPTHYIAPTTSKAITAYRPTIPTDATGWLSFPLDARHWLLRAGVGADMTARWGIVWSEKHKTLVIPVQQAGKLVGVVHRGFHDDNRYRLLTDAPSACFLRPFSPLDAPIVLCEDSLSAIRLTEAGFNGVALLGVWIRAGVKEWCALSKQRTLVVWLDNDNSNVARAAMKAAKEFPYMLVRVVRGESDPKHYTEQQIKEILWKTLS